MSKPVTWPAIVDEELVERLMAVLQETVNTEVADTKAFHGSDVANVLLMLLATILEASPACATPQGMRKLAEAAGKELHLLLKDTRLLTDAAAKDNLTAH